MTKTIALRTALLAGLATLPACGTSQGPDTSTTGEFQATVTGAATAELSGFASSEGEEGLGWAVFLITPGGESNIMLLASEIGRPGPGTYQLADIASTLKDPPPGVYSAMVGLNSVPAPLGHRSISGTFTVTSSSPDAVSGRFDFLAGDPADAAGQISVIGTFTSRNAGG